MSALARRGDDFAVNAHPSSKLTMMLLVAVPGERGFLCAPSPNGAATLRYDLQRQLRLKMAGGGYDSRAFPLYKLIA